MIHTPAECDKSYTCIYMSDLFVPSERRKSSRGHVQALSVLNTINFVQALSVLNAIHFVRTRWPCLPVGVDVRRL